MRLNYEITLFAALFKEAVQIILMKYLLTILFIATLAVSNVTAQLYGHVNSTAIISSMPSVKAADSQIEDYSKQLIGKGQKMVKDFEAAVAAYQEKVNLGDLSQIEMQQQEAALGQQQQAIGAYEVEVQDLIVKKKQEVYQPILDSVQEMINAIGKERGFSMIFDSANMGMIFAADSEDLTQEVKDRLGIQ